MVAPLWVDTDVALGAERGDVDDGFALAAVVRAAARPGARFQLAGVSAVAGNTDARTAARCARGLLEVLGARAVPVVDQDEAPRVLASLPEGTSLLLLGPPSNLVAAQTLAPGLPARLEVRAVGGLLRPHRHPILRLSDLNFRRDPGATRTFLATTYRRRILFPLDVVLALRLGASDLARVAGAGPAGEYLARHSQRWLRRSRWRNLGRGFPAWDLVPALDAGSGLPGARFEGDRLAAFQPAAARDLFLNLLNG